MTRFTPLPSTEATQLQNLARTIWRLCYPGIISTEQIEQMIDTTYDPQRIVAEIETKNIAYWKILDESGQWIGYYAHDSLDSYPDEVFLHKLYVHPDHQRSGHGSAALARMVTDAKCSGIQRLALRVNRNNAQAIRAYESNGFIVKKEICTEIGHGFVMDDYFMVRRLGG